MDVNATQPLICNDDPFNEGPASLFEVIFIRAVLIKQGTSVCGVCRHRLQSGRRTPTQIATRAPLPRGDAARFTLG